MSRKSTETPKKRSCKRTNEILEDNDDWMLIDISTPKFPTAKMAVDADVWKLHDGGRVYAKISTVSNHKYIYASFKKDRGDFLFHRSVICGEEIDHINHGTMSFIDNRRANLRSVTKSQNQMNASPISGTKSCVTGVVLHKSGKWQAQIKVNGKNRYLGLFDNIDFAIGARQQAEREYFGEFAFNARVTK